MVDGAFHGVEERTGLVVAVGQDHHFIRVHDGTHADRKRPLGDQVDVTAEETRVGDDRVGSQ